ncbi:MAG: nodulation protein NfeD [Acidobacteriota bacterium]|nr:nodulation protein NfeD [Acidobacteriota bacterium]
MRPMCSIMRLASAAVAIALLLARASTSIPAPPEVVLVEITGVIQPVTTEIIARAFDQAAERHASAVILRLNTPGGLMDAMRQSIEKIVAAPVPVITYVGPSGGRAASAGFFLLEAGDLAAMAPGTNTGAAHPVLMGGQMDPIMKQKVENDAAASLRSLTAKRERNSDLAQKAVLESKSFTEKEALENHLIEIIAPNVADLLASLNNREIVRFNGSKQVLHLAGAKIVPYEETLRQRIFSEIGDPNLAIILLMLGALGVYVEFSAPGLIFPGVIGAILALLGLSALSVLPINWLGASLLILSLVMFVLEAKFASHGILAAGGAVAMVLGALMLVDSPVPELRIHLATALSVALPFAAITAVLVSLVVRARANKVVIGGEAMIGQIGVAMEDLSPEGRLLVRGEYWNAVSTNPVRAGARARVTGIDGADRLRLTVKELE